MTKREARKIATLNTAARLSMMENFYHPDIDDDDKVREQEHRLARKLAARYDVTVGGLPFDEQTIAERVLGGSL